MRAETPSWPFSNLFNVRFSVCGVYVVSTDFSLLYFFGKCKSFFRLFLEFSHWEFCAAVENSPVIFPNISGWFFAVLWCKNRTIPCFRVWLPLFFLTFWHKCDIIKGYWLFAVSITARDEHISNIWERKWTILNVGEIVAVLLQEGTPTQETLTDLSAERAKELLPALLDLGKRITWVAGTLAEKLATNDGDYTDNSEGVRAPLNTKIDSRVFCEAGIAAGCPKHMVTRVMYALRGGRYRIPGDSDVHNFVTIADILECPYTSWSRIQNFGRASRNALEKIMLGLGYAEFKIT